MSTGRFSTTLINGLPAAESALCVAGSTPEELFFKRSKVVFFGTIMRFMHKVSLSRIRWRRKARGARRSLYPGKGRPRSYCGEIRFRTSQRLVSVSFPFLSSQVKKEEVQETSESLVGAVISRKFSVLEL